MSPRTKDFVRRATPWVGLLVGAVTIIGAARATANALYVRTSVYRLDRTTDSLTFRVELREQRAMIAGLDSSDKCKRGLRGYCR